MRRVVVCALFVAAACVLSVQAQAPQTLKGKVAIGVHDLDLRDDTIYFIKAEGQGFRPDIEVRGTILQQNFGFTPNLYEGVCAPTESKKYLMLVRPSAFPEAPRGLKDYTVTIKTFGLEAKPLLDTKDEVTKDDPPQAGSPAKKYKVNLKKGLFYIVDVKRRSKDYSPSVFLLDASKKGPFNAVGQAFGDQNGLARMLFKPLQEGDYEIAVGSLNRSTGPFALNVRVQKEAKETAE